MKKEKVDFSVSKKTTQYSKISQTNNQQSISEIKIENNDGTDEFFERFETSNQQQVPNNNLIIKNSEAINFEAIQSLEKNSKEKNINSKRGGSSYKKDNKSKN